MQGACGNFHAYAECNTQKHSHQTQHSKSSSNDDTHYKWKEDIRDVLSIQCYVTDAIKW